MLIIEKIANLFYKYINSNKNIKNSWQSRRIIYYSLLNKRFTSKSQIACILNRLTIVKFDIYTIGKVIFYIKSIIK